MSRWCLHAQLANYEHRYGEQVENYLEVYLRTPGLSKDNVAKALLARGNARKAAGEKLLAKAQQGMSARHIVLSTHADRTLHGRLPSRSEVGPLQSGPPSLPPKRERGESKYRVWCPWNLVSGRPTALVWQSVRVIGGAQRSVVIVDCPRRS